MRHTLLALLSTLLLSSSCAGVDAISHKSCETVVAQPSYFWKGSQMYTVCYDEKGHMVFPNGAASNDPLTNMMGPVAGSIASHVVIPVQ